jgi:hypothetical protein
MLFDKVLRRIPQDGTFDQTAPVRRLISLLKGGRDHRVWSFDLSAATDRIPVVLQEVLLGVFMTPEFASHWRMLLCDREYRAPAEYVKQNGWKRSPNGEKLDVSLKYAVGQPMGAYSSWAMLALVHHMMVQYAAWKAGSRGWFERYAVLGDDLVIGDHRVAAEYIKLTEVMGVEVNMSKSIVSDNLSLEFAKRFWYKGEEVTPLPLLAIAIGWLGVRDIAEIAGQVYSRTGKLLSLYNLGRFVNLGFKTSSGLANKLIRSLGRKARSIVLLLTRPGAPYGVGSLLQWYALNRANGSSYNTEGVWPAIADSVTARVKQFQSLNLRRRLYRALVGFSIQRCMNKLVPDRMAWFGIAEWWHKEVIEPFRAPILRKLDEIDAMIVDVNRAITKKDEATLLRLLEAMELLEEQVALVPTEVTLVRDEQEIVRPPADKFPKRVRSWNRLIRKFHRAYQDSQHK